MITVVRAQKPVKKRSNKEAEGEKNSVGRSASKEGCCKEWE